MYTEYFQWSPTHNSNSRQHSVEAGQTLHGQLYYISSQDAYVLNQTVVETGASSSQVVPCQSGKKYTVPYVVYEKTWPCGDYPPDGKVSFNIVASECDGAPCDITWEAKVKDPNCNMQAVIGTNQIDLTWDTSAKSKYDGMSRDELAQRTRRSGARVPARVGGDRITVQGCGRPAGATELLVVVGDRGGHDAAHNGQQERPQEHRERH